MADTYRIRVQGELDQGWSDRFAGMKITVNRSDPRAVVTTLRGPLRDQAALAGVLDTLYQMHLPVLSVNAQRRGAK